MIYRNELVSIIVRNSSIDKIWLLQGAIDSIEQNIYRPIEVIIVVQTENDNHIQSVEKIANNFQNPDFKVKIIINYTSNDERAKNLNLGIKKSQGRYLGFLDDDDIIYSNHLQTIINYLQKSKNCSWAYVDVARVLCKSSNNIVTNTKEIEIISTDYPYNKQEFNYNELLKDNFIPIHSYLIDRDRVDNNILKFNESMTMMEDYEFLLRLAFEYNPIHISKVTCEYRFWSDASNSSFHVNQLLGINYKSKVRSWKKASNHIEKLKKQLVPSYSPGLLSYSNRKLILSNFAFIYRMKKRFPKLWNLMKQSFYKIGLIKY